MAASYRLPPAPSDSSHSRNPSEDTVSSASSYQQMLEHILTYPGTYEIPLRTMYTLNCAPRAQPLPQGSRSGSRAGTPTSSPCASPTSPHFDHTAHLTSNLMSHIAQLPSQPCSLPPAFIVSFLRRCFTPELTRVDFPQALAALDYLKDLETRRRREMSHVLQRLGLHNAPERENDPTEHPGIMLWVRNLEGKDKKVEVLYTQLYLSLRRWIMINELSLTPFNKHNCIAMLNTLYPPVISGKPTRQLDFNILQTQRDGFFKYINAVQKQGRRAVDTLVHQGKQPGDETGWPVVYRTLDEYIRTTSHILEDCQAVDGPEYFGPLDFKRHGRKVDSGIAFDSEKRPSTGDSLSTVNKPLPPRPHPPKSPKSGSKLEKITREFRKLRGKKIEVDEIIPSRSFEFKDFGREREKPVEEKKQAKTLKKMRSLGAISSLPFNNSSTSLAGGRRLRDAPPFDKEAMRLERMRYEATVSHRKQSSYDI